MPKLCYALQNSYVCDYDYPTLKRDDFRSCTRTCVNSHFLFFSTRCTYYNNI